MPTYDYRCRDCGHEFEIQQSFSDDALTVCPVCQGNLRKVFGAVGISFKGSGFYKTDSRPGSKRPSRGDGEKAGDQAGGKPGGDQPDAKGDGGGSKDSGTSESKPPSTSSSGGESSSAATS